MGLFKYYSDKERFIKIYGGERCQNIILYKNINVKEEEKKTFDIFSSNMESPGKQYEFMAESKISFDHKSYLVIKRKSDRLNTYVLNI